MYSRAGHTAETSGAPVTLIRSGVPVTRKVTLAAGTAYAIGSVLGIVTATGKAVLSTSAANDGSQTPMFVLRYPVNAVSADVEAIAIERGDLIGSQLVFGAGHTLASTREGLRGKGITLSL